MRSLHLILAAAMVLGTLTSVRAADIIWVHQMRGGGDGTAGPAAGGGSLTWEDDQWRQLIEGRGHNITMHDRFDDLEVVPLDQYDATIADFEAADLVIFSRDSNSGDYNDPFEHDIWTSEFSTPMIIMTPYLLRSNRWDMVQSTTIVDAANPMQAVQADHPIFEGVALGDNDTVEFFSQLGPEDNIDLLETLDYGFGEVIAVESETEIPWIVYWDPAVENGDFYSFSTTFAGGPRLYLSAGSDDDPNTWGEKNITPAGDQIVLNAITFLTGDPGVVLNPNDLNGDGVVDFNDLGLLGQGETDKRDAILAEANLLAGDLDGVGGVAFPDFLTLSNNFGQNVDSYLSGDIDLNGTVAFPDFLELSNNFGKTAAAASVPEPTGAFLLSLAGLLLGFVRRRRRSA